MMGAKALVSCNIAEMLVVMIQITSINPTVLYTVGNTIAIVVIIRLYVI
jgi:hypothetical protein